MNETGMDLFDYYCKNAYPEIGATMDEEFFAGPSSRSHLQVGHLCCSILYVKLLPGDRSYYRSYY